MKITNKLGLPKAFVKMAESDYEYKPKQYSVTSLLKGTREIILERRYHHEIEQDVSDMIWLLFGTAVHSILEHHEADEHEVKEHYLKVPIGDYTLSGRCDLYNKKTKTITDYKTCSVWKIIYGDFEDWRQQLLMYAYMFRTKGYEVEQGEIIALLKDHSKGQAQRKKDYPDLPVKRLIFQFTEKDFEEIEEWIIAKFEEIAEAEKLPDDELSICTPEQRFNDGDKFAVKEEGRKTALRVLDSLDEAIQWAKMNKKGDYIEIRYGKNKKCENYCNVNKFCNYYKEMKERKNRKVALNEVN